MYTCTHIDIHICMLCVYIHIYIPVHTPTHTHTRTSVARAFAINVLLHPGGPYKSTPAHESWYMSIQEHPCPWVMVHVNSPWVMVHVNSLHTRECLSLSLSLIQQSPHTWMPHSYETWHLSRESHATSHGTCHGTSHRSRASHGTCHGAERLVYMCHDSFTGVGRLIDMCRDSFTRESWYVSMSHGTCQCATTHMNESLYPCPWVMVRVNESCHRSMGFPTPVSESWHIYTSLSAPKNESRDLWMSHGTCEGVMPRVIGSCVNEHAHMSHMNTCRIWIGRDTYKWVSLPLWLSHGPCEIVMAHMIGSCVHQHVSYTYGRTGMQESRPTPSRRIHVSHHTNIWLSYQTNTRLLSDEYMSLMRHVFVSKGVNVDSLIAVLAHSYAARHMKHVIWSTSYEARWLTRRHVSYQTCTRL